jgi:predicted MFS family arabinose efflux permease
VTQRREPSFGRQLAYLVFGRILLTTSSRFIYPFLPELGRGLGVTQATLARVVGLRSLVGLFGPAISVLSERFGRKPVLLASMGLFAGSCLLVLIRPNLWLFGLALAASSLAKVVYDPSMHAFIADRVPYAQRGRALGLAETSWAFGLLLGAPLAGVVMRRQGWQAPFGWLALLGLFGVFVLWRTLPSIEAGIGRPVGVRRILRLAFSQPVLAFAALYAFLIMAANEIVFVYYGDWLERTFQLSLSSLGLASAVIGGAELSGELLVGWAADRFGKLRVVLLAGLLSALAYAVLPSSSGSLALALALMFILFMAFEMSFVGLLPIYSELLPSARSVSLAVLSMSVGLGRAAGAAIAPAIQALGGFAAAGLVAGGVTLLALLILRLRVVDVADGS